MRSRPFGDEGVVVILAASGNGIKYSNDSILVDKDVAGSQGLMLDSLLLEVAETHNAAGQYRPQLFLLELPLLQVPLVDLVLQRSFGELEQCVYFVEGRTVLVLNFGDYLLQRNDVFAPTQLIFPLLQKFNVPFVLFFVIKGELSQQIIASVLFTFEEEQAIAVDGLHYFVILQKKGIFVALSC